MVKHTQTIRLQQLMNCLSVFDHFMGLALKGLISYGLIISKVLTWQVECPYYYAFPLSAIGLSIVNVVVLANGDVVLLY